ncbi:putative lipid II flippase FtsW [Candidatus Saccharibacteria bacterium CPR2]|nr:putative lipid II flippase FtsW [Candidatus Saccharibacteria bacterium CPR2]
MSYSQRGSLSLPFRRHRPDYGIILITGILILLGLILIYSISPALQQRSQEPISEYHFIYRQLAFIGIGLVVFMLSAKLPLRVWRDLLPVLVILSILSLLLLPIIGTEANGAKRWIDIGWFWFQPAELVKFTMIIYLANFLSERTRLEKINDRSHTIWPFLFVLLGVGLFVVILQKDLGTMISIVFIALTMLYMSGVKVRDFLTICAALVGLGIGAVIMFPHRLSRITAFLHPEDNTESTSYHINQALIAIGSGGWLGRGLGKSVQVFGYLPEPANDSIFAILAEKFGFIGSVFVLFLYGALFVKILRIIPRSPNQFTCLITSGVFAWLFGHVVINIGAMIGILPLTGITLPFISLGGSSMVFILGGLGIVFNISRFTDLSPVVKGGKSYESTALRGRHGRPRYAA